MEGLEVSELPTLGIAGAAAASASDDPFAQAGLKSDSDKPYGDLPVDANGCECSRCGKLPVNEDPKA